MTKTKYVMSNGLAFDEDADLKKLRKLSLKGWHVKGFQFMGYILEKGEAKDYIYSLDYRPLTAMEEEEYFAFFASAGWTHIASERDVHLFQAQPGTMPIYSDSHTAEEKYDHLALPLKMLIIPLCIITLFAWGGAWLFDGTLQSILFGAALILSILFLLIVWTTLGAYTNKWKLHGKTKLAHLVNWLPVLFSLIVVAAILFIDMPDKALLTILVIIVVSVIFPAIISLIMNVKVKITAKRN